MYSYLNGVGSAEGVNGNVLAIQAHHCKQLKLGRVERQQVPELKVKGGSINIGPSTFAVLLASRLKYWFLQTYPRNRLR